MSVIDKLLIVQERDTKIRNMEQEIQDIPARQKQEESRLEKHKVAKADAEGVLMSCQAKLNECEVENTSLAEKIAKLRQQQLEIKTNKEFSAIESEISSIIKEVSKLEDKELAIMEEIDKGKAGVADMDMALKKEEASVQESIQSLNGRVTMIEQELKKEQELRVIAAGDVDSEWLSRYEQIFSRKDIAVAKVDEGVCGGCHMALPPAVIHIARAQSEMITCDFCGRMLY